MDSYIEVKTLDGPFRAYVARPPEPASAAIVVLQEIFGVNADLRATCDELAGRGYLAVSPDLFWRLEPGVDMSDQSEAEWTRGMALYNAFDYEKGIEDIASTIAAARSLLGAAGKVGLMGYCFGGLLTFIATARKRVDASVVSYGGNTEKHLDEAGNIRSPLMIHLGEEDEYISKAAQKAIIAALRDNPMAQVLTYPGSMHAFARHQGIHYDKQAAALANHRTGDFFRLHLA